MVKYSKILTILGIVCVAGFLLVFGVKLQAQNKMGNNAPNIDGKNMQVEDIKANFENSTQRSNWGSRGRQQGANQGRQQPGNWRGQERSRNNDSGDSSSFYQVIVNNNIFRPLGWRPPNKEPEYAYIGSTVDLNGVRVEAYVEETRSKRFYTASVGDQIGDAVVKEIQEKQVILDKNGESITLRRGKMQFLQSGSGRGGGSRGARNENEENNRNDSDNENTARQAASNQRDNRSGNRGQDMRSRFQNASPEERAEMIRQFRGGRGGRSRGRDR